MSNNGSAVGTQLSVGFITALVSDELKGCEETLLERGWVQLQAERKLQEGNIKKWSKHIRDTPVIAYSMAVANMGQVASALETFMFMTRCNPNELYLTGIAGSLDKENIHKADVIIGTSINWRTQDKVFGEEACDKYRVRVHSLKGYDPDVSRDIQVFVSNNYVQKDRKESDLDNWNVVAGEIFTWEYVVNSERVTAKINTDFPKAKCVEMEAGGFLSAIDRFAVLTRERHAGLEALSVPKGFVIRGISDYAAKKDKVANVRKLASKNAAKVAIDFAEYRVQNNLARIADQEKLT